MMKNFHVMLKRNKVVIILVGLIILAFVIVFAATKPSAQSVSLITVPNMPEGKSATLVVMLHAYTNTSFDLNSAKKVMQSTPEFKDADFLVPDLPFSTFSMENPNKIVHELMLAIDKLWLEHQYSKIILVGHSMGALLARKIYVLAVGENDSAKFEEDFKMLSNAHQFKYEKPRPWARNIERIVLLAGMNNGWSISHHMDLQNMITMNIGTMFGHVLEWMHHTTPIIFAIRNGSGFITQLRLQWIAMKDEITIRNKQLGDVLTVQLLGTVDDLVPPTDNVDLVTGADFQYIEVPHSGHANVIDMSVSNTSNSKELIRANKFLEALSSYRIQPVIPKKVKDVVFVVHGIRDAGYWTEKIARRIELLGEENNRTFATVYSSYGYFPMLGFLRPGARDEKVQWFMNNYAVAKAKYPKAKFHFVGHSHGTYLLARAIEKYKSVTFENVSFAGSVVLKNFDWQTVHDQNRVAKVMNYTASSDWVVGWFPNALEMLGLQDLGSAGHNGFEQATTASFIHNEGFVTGGHSAAIQEDAWDTIASFIVLGEFEPLPKQLKSIEHHWFVKATAFVAPMIWILGLMILIYGLYKLSKLNIREWKKTVLIIAYVFGVWTVLTKV